MQPKKRHSLGLAGKAAAGDETSYVRFLLWMDMEGVSQVTDFRETLPVHREYWRSGREKLTADAAAAAEGLMKGGAGEVVVIDGHGLGWTNLIEEELPAGARMFGQGDRFEDFDGLLLAGFHARCGTTDGFMSHTFVPHMRVSLNDSLVTECHVWALRAGLPVLGVTGDRVLGSQLDGILHGTPFLGVKDSSSRSSTVPLHATGKRSAEAIREFGEACAKGRHGREESRLSVPFTLSVSMPAELTRYAERQAGLQRRSGSVLTLRAKDWKREADGAVDVAMGAAASPLIEVLHGLDLSSEKGIGSADPAVLEEARQYFANWIKGESRAWED